MSDMIRPKPLRAGDRIGVISPSYWLEPSRWQAAQRLFEHRGFELVAGDTVNHMSFRHRGESLVLQYCLDVDRRTGRCQRLGSSALGTERIMFDNSIIAYPAN